MGRQEGEHRAAFRRVSGTSDESGSGESGLALGDDLPPALARAQRNETDDESENHCGAKHATFFVVDEGEVIHADSTAQLRRATLEVRECSIIRSADRLREN
jgi:hypothetical protein